MLPWALRALNSTFCSVSSFLGDLGKSCMTCLHCGSRVRVRVTLLRKPDPCLLPPYGFGHLSAPCLGQSCDICGSVGCHGADHRATISCCYSCGNFCTWPPIKGAVPPQLCSLPLHMHQTHDEGALGCTKLLFSSTPPTFSLEDNAKDALTALFPGLTPTKQEQVGREHHD